MATRFRLTNDDTDPAVTPAHQSYTHTRTTAAEYRQLKTADSSTLATTAYTPDAADDLVAGDSLHSTFVSAGMAAGIQFTSADVIKVAIQGLEPNTGCNMGWQLWVGIYDTVGTTLQRTLRSKVAEGNEFSGAATNRFLSTTQSGATYTTAAGDVLVVEIGVTGTPTAATGVNGHNASLRFGGSGASGDLPENDAETGATFNPWIEFIPTITFGTDASVTPATVARSVTVPQLTQQASASITPSTVGRSVTVPQASSSASSSLTSAVVARSVVIPQVTVETSSATEVAQATETDLAQAIGRAKVAAIGEAVETDFASALARNIKVAEELDTATALDIIMGTVGTGIVRSPNRARIYAAHNEVT